VNPPADHPPTPDPDGEDLLFGPAADEYARFRPGVPEQVAWLLADAVKGVPDGTLLVVTLHPLLGNRALSCHEVPADRFNPQRPNYWADLITCCRAFHWMNRPAVLAMATRVEARTRRSHSWVTAACGPTKPTGQAC
jgi:hypothetical protein